MKTTLSRPALAALILFASAFLRLFVAGFLDPDVDPTLRVVGAVVILAVGAAFVLRRSAAIIEETTEAISRKTHLAGGMLQSLGTAFPDMVLGVVAAMISLSVRATNAALAIDYAVIAAATTFGSNIYNIGFAAWCIFRQNRANGLKKAIPMFPLVKSAAVRPIHEHTVKPILAELDVSMDLLNVLTLLTAAIAMCMVLFGRVAAVPEKMTGDLYQLVQPLGALFLGIAALVVYRFRKTVRPESPVAEIETEERFFVRQPIWRSWLYLVLAGIAILMTAEAMIHGIRVLSEIFSIPPALAGLAAGIIGCLGEMIVIYDFTVDPHGRIGDAIVGIAMDNIVTICGAAIVAVMGGIFLGGNALILIFIGIVALNSVLMWQISKLKNALFAKR